MFKAIAQKLSAMFSAPAKAAYIRPAPRKHIRITYWTFDVSVSYYGETGRKLTTRRYAMRDIVRIRNMARAAGYHVI